MISKVKSLDDNSVTLQRTVEHLKANNVDLAKTPLSLGPMLEFDNDTENSPTMMVQMNYWRGIIGMALSFHLAIKSDPHLTE